MRSFETFVKLHQQEAPLLIGNFWDVNSARIFETNGFKAIATSSSAVAHSMGYEDGEQIPFEFLLQLAKKVAETAQIPCSVDMEKGYSRSVTGIVDNIKRLYDVGIVGINLEDAQGEDIYLKKLNGIKNYLAKTNQQLFVNARTDVFLQKLPNPLETTIRRAKLYKEAGADGLFVTGVQDIKIIKEIVSSTTLPVNVVNANKTVSLSELPDCGVKRISMAVLLYKATYKKVEVMAKEILDNQSLEILF